MNFAVAGHGGSSAAASRTATSVYPAASASSSSNTWTSARAASSKGTFRACARGFCMVMRPRRGNGSMTAAVVGDARVVTKLGIWRLVTNVSWIMALAVMLLS
jgi:exo-beta-1,3-glucanase (GH17 family)